MTEEQVTKINSLMMSTELGDSRNQFLGDVLKGVAAAQEKWGIEVLEAKLLLCAFFVALGTQEINWAPRCKP